MIDKDLYATILGIRSPWSVTEVTLSRSDEEVSVHIALDPDAPLQCPRCAAVSRRYDSRPRRWRHLDTCEYRTMLVADVPRVECREHGVLQIFIPWAEPGGRFTARFEGLVIDWMKEACITAVARRLRLTWDEVDGIQARAVARGLARRRRRTSRRLGVDETSFAKRHEYVTVVTDMDSGHVVHVEDDRGRAALDNFYSQLTPQQRGAIEVVAMDMWEPYIQATFAALPEADRKIVFDKFHVAKHLGDAVDTVRRTEQRELLEQGDRTLVGTKYFWLTSSELPDGPRAERFDSLRTSTLKVAKAWHAKEVAMELWCVRRRCEVVQDFQAWCRWATRLRMDPLRKVARMISSHLDGIVNAVLTGVTNALAEGTNSKIQWIKKMARGFRNRQRFRNAIYFHLGGLDLYPACLFLTHTKA